MPRHWTVRALLTSQLPMPDGAVEEALKQVGGLRTASLRGGRTVAVTVGLDATTFTAARSATLDAMRAIESGLAPFRCQAEATSDPYLD